MEDRERATLFLHFIACHPAAALDNLPIRENAERKKKKKDNLRDDALTSCRFNKE